MAAEMAQRVGSRIRKRREELGRTQEQVASAMPGKTTPDQVSRWERGAHHPRDLTPLAKALDVDVTYFYMDEPDKTATPDPFPPAAADIEQRLARMEATLAKHAKAVEKLLARQSKVLARIEQALDAEAETASRLAAVDDAFGERVEALAVRLGL